MRKCLVLTLAALAVASTASANIVWPPSAPPKHGDDSHPPMCFSFVLHQVVPCPVVTN